jgi:hypothetical protein
MCFFVVIWYNNGVQKPTLKTILRRIVMKKWFTDSEVDILQAARKSGGIFLRIYEDEKKVEVLVSDGNYGYKPTKTLDRSLSSKIKEAYANQTQYNAPHKDGTFDVSLAWFIVCFSS